MKQCPVCQEEFADKFSFCPVDGTPLNGFVAQRAEMAMPVQAPAASAVPPVIPVEETATQAYGASPSQDSGEDFDQASAVADSYNTSGSASSHVGEYHLTIIEDQSILSRLAEELREVSHQYQLTWPEFKRDPAGFVKRSIVGYGQILKRFFARPNVAIAMLAAVLSMGLIVAAVAWLDRAQAAEGASRGPIIIFTVVALVALAAILAGWMKRDRSVQPSGALAGDTVNTGLTSETADTQGFAIATIVSFVFVLAIIGGLIWADYRARHNAQVLAEKQRTDLEYLGDITDIPPEQEQVDKGPAGTNKGTGGGSKPKQDKPGGGGGGGRQEEKPASYGKLPQASLTIPQVLAPDPNPPKIKNPSLPVAATIDADPLLFPTDTRPIPYGDPKSKSTDLSS
ncbi:MAG TPA: hypothetical protein VF544_14055, partial [Pyrinomonadaceae bacterium]